MAEPREIGGTGVRVPAVGFGTAGLGHMPDTFGYGVDEARALATVRAVLALPDGFLDSSRLYGMGRSEERIGKVVAELGGWPEGRVLSTKLDRDPETGRIDAGQACRRGQQAHYGQRRHRLAATGFAKQRKGLAGLDLEGNLIHGVTGVDLHRQTVHPQQGRLRFAARRRNAPLGRSDQHHAVFPRGSKASRTASARFVSS